MTGQKKYLESMAKRVVSTVNSLAARNPGLRRFAFFILLTYHYKTLIYHRQADRVSL
jgi:hypothetical protein